MRKLAGAMLLVICCGTRLDTAADACYYLGTTFCGRATACHAATDATACANTFTNSCCSAGDCSKPIKRTDLITACDGELRAMTCGQVVGGLLPSGCLGVVGKSE